MVVGIEGCIVTCTYLVHHLPYLPANATSTAPTSQPQPEPEPQQNGMPRGSEMERGVEVPGEPGEEEEGVAVVAVRLPSGERIERRCVQ